MATNNDRIQYQMKLDFGQLGKDCGGGLKDTAEGGDLLLRLSYYKVSKENLGWKLSEQDVTLETMMASLKQLEKKLRSAANE